MSTLDDEEEPSRFTPPTEDELRRLARADTIRRMLPQHQLISSVRIEATEMLGPPRIGELVPIVSMVVNEGTPTEVRFGTEELSGGLVKFLIYEARDALYRRFAKPLDAHAAIPLRCGTCGMGPVHPADRGRKTG